MTGGIFFPRLAESNLVDWKNKGEKPASGLSPFMDH